MKKVFFLTFSVLFVSILTSFLAPSAKAESTVIRDFVNNQCSSIMAAQQTGSTWYNPSFCDFHAKVHDTTNPDELFGERYTFAQLAWIFKSIPSYLLNNIAVSLDSILTSLGLGQGNSLSPFAQNTPAPNSAIGFPAWFISNRSDDDLSFVGSVASMLGSFNPATEVKAQGFGFRTLSGLRPIANSVRNTTYLFMVVILVAAGLAIIARVKLNAQTVVSIQVMIPKIIFTLILVTFSYAISGFVIDMVYIILGFVGYMLPAEISTNKASVVSFLTNSDPSSILSFFAATVLPISLLMSRLPYIGQFLVWIIPVVVGVLVFKAFWALLKSYITLILSVIVAPLQIGIGLFPTTKQGFGVWFRNLVASASTFVVFPLMLLLAMIFWQPTATDGTGIDDLVFNTYNIALSSIGLIPQINGIPANSFPSLPLFGNISAGSAFSISGLLFKAICAYGVLAMMPKTMDMVRASLQASKLDFDDNTFSSPFATAASFGRGRGLSVPSFEDIGNRMRADAARVASSLGGGRNQSNNTPTSTTTPTGAIPQQGN